MKVTVTDSCGKTGQMLVSLNVKKENVCCVVIAVRTGAAKHKV